MSEEISGEQLRALRLAAGLDVAVLARRVSLSNAQLLQLENDQHSLFYTLAIRRHAARKVLAHLGYQAAPGESGDALILAAEPVLSDRTVPPPQDGQAATDALRITLGHLPMRDLSEPLEPIAGSMTAPPQALAGAGGRWPSVDRSADRTPRYTGLGWVAVVLVTALLPAWLVLKRPFASAVTPAADGPQAAQVVGPIEPSAAPMAELPINSAAPGSVPRPQAQENLERDLVALAPAGSPPALSGLTESTLQARPGQTPSCPDRLEPAPSVALKSVPGQGSLIYLLSSVTQVVCVLDGSGKVKSHRLEPGQVKGVAGPPPWTLQASAVQTIQVYFQGARVKLPPEAQDRVQLVGPD